MSVQAASGYRHGVYTSRYRLLVILLDYCMYGAHLYLEMDTIDSDISV
jgi:hypothetical protein